MNKLVEISSGKWSSVAPVPKKVPAKRTHSVKVGTKGPVSLNMLIRKKETERIEKENHAFAKRLFDKQAVLNKKHLDSDWRNHIKYKRQIQKMPPLPKSKLIITSDVRRSHQGLTSSQMGGAPQQMMLQQYDNGVNVVGNMDGSEENQNFSGQDDQNQMEDQQDQQDPAQVQEEPAGVAQEQQNEEQEAPANNE